MKRQKVTPNGKEEKKLFESLQETLVSFISILGLNKGYYSTPEFEWEDENLVI